MAFDNGVHFCGRLTKDPEIKEAGAHKVCNFTLARNKYTKDKDHPEADFVDFVAWDSTAELLAKYFTKGSRVGVYGELQSRTYEDKDGNKRKITEVRVLSISFVDTKSDHTSGSSEDRPSQGKPDTTGYEEVPASDDDLPF